MSDKVYVGRVETKEGKYGELVSVSLGPQDFEKLEAAKNERGWVNLNWKQAKDGGYYMEVYQNAGSGGGAKASSAKQAFTQNQSNDLPF
jgi:hypothetical protein